MLRTRDAGVPWTALSLVGVTRANDTVWKLFSGERMPRAWLEMMFEGGFEVAYERAWEVGVGLCRPNLCGWWWWWWCVCVCGWVGGVRGGGLCRRNMRRSSQPPPPPPPPPGQAYPKFDPPEDFSRWELAPGLYYSSALENAASALEIAAISGRNAALLAAQHLRRRARGAAAAAAAAA